MAASAVRLKRYLRTSYRPDREFIDGRIVRRNVGDFPHSRMMALVAAQLIVAEKRCGMVGLMSCRTQVSPTRIRVPDLILMPRTEPTTGIVKTPPFLCVEVLSPLDSRAGVNKRVTDYLEIGVQYVWVIDPETRRATIYSPEGVHEVSGGILQTQNPDITVDLNNRE